MSYDQMDEDVRRARDKWRKELKKECEILLEGKTVKASGILFSSSQSLDLYPASRQKLLFYMLCGETTRLVLSIRRANSKYVNPYERQLKVDSCTSA